MRIPGVMLRDTIVVEPVAGLTGAGVPSFGAAETLKASVEPKRRVVQSPDGDQVVTDVVALVKPGPVLPPGSRVTWNGRSLAVLTEGEMHDVYLELSLGAVGGQA